MKTLPITESTSNISLELNEPIAIMTHDDEFDGEMYEYEKAHGYKSTSFLLTNKINEINQDADIQLHYDMTREEWVDKQIEEFKQKTNQIPIINRNHRVFWRESHLDLANLSMNGIKVDSSLLNQKPFKLCVQSRILPIWEVPYNVVDEPYVDITKNVHCTYNVSAKMEDLFSKAHTPIVGLFHPYLKDKTNWKKFFDLVDKYKYKLMTMTEFYEKYLK